jgi:ribosomal protein S18 acetylase RimI-like enzyme
MLGDEVNVRLATPDDAQCVSALATQVFLETYATSGIRLALAREAQSQFGLQTIERLLDDASRSVALAERAAHLVGFAEIAHGATHDLVPSSSSAELARLYVQSPFVHQGIGTLLLRHSEALARARGASTLWLTAWVGNTRALAFYAGRGYLQLGSTEYVFEGEAFENRLFAKELELDPGGNR